MAPLVVAVTGASGFIGSHVVRTLLATADGDGFTVRAVVVRPPLLRTTCRRLADVLAAVGATARVWLVAGALPVAVATARLAIGPFPAPRGRGWTAPGLLPPCSSTLLTSPRPSALSPQPSALSTQHPGLVPPPAAPSTQPPVLRPQSSAWPACENIAPRSPAAASACPACEKAWCARRRRTPWPRC